MGSIKKNALGATGLLVSEMAMGTSGMASIDYGDKPVGDEYIKTLRKGLSLGVNVVDTAAYYGSEKLVGQALQGIPRKDYVLITKCCRYKTPEDKGRFGRFDFSKASVLKSIDESLKNLGTDHVDILHIHDVEFADDIGQVVNEAVRAADEVKRAGKANFIGVTGYDTDVLKEVIEKSPVKIDVTLTYARATLQNTDAFEFIDWCKGREMGVFNASPIAMGLLSGRTPQPWHPASQEIRTACAAAQEYCKEVGVSLPRLAFKFAQQTKGADSLVVGCLNEQELEQNIRALNTPLTAIENDAITTLRERFFAPVAVKHWTNFEVNDYRKLQGKP